MFDPHGPVALAQAALLFAGFQVTLSSDIPETLSSVIRLSVGERLRLSNKDSLTSRPPRRRPRQSRWRNLLRHSRSFYCDSFRVCRASQRFRVSMCLRMRKVYLQSNNIWQPQRPF